MATAKQSVKRWLADTFKLNDITLEDFPLMPGGTILRDRNGGEMLVYLDILTDTVKWTFPKKEAF